MNKPVYEVDVLAVAERILSRPAGPFRASVIEIRALALFVIQQQSEPENEKENQNEQRSE